MKNLIKNPNVLMVGAGILAFLVTRYICTKVRANRTTTNEPKSNMGGCGCGA